MYRLISLMFGSSLIIISILALIAPASALSIVMDTAMPSAVLRISFALLLMAYAVAPMLRYDFSRDLLLFSGIAGLVYLMVSLYADNLPYPEPLDMFFIIHGATVAAVAATDFARPKAVRKFLPNITPFELLAARISTIKLRLPTPTASSAVTRKTKTA